MTTPAEHYRPAVERAQAGLVASMDALRGSPYAAVGQAAFTRLSHAGSKARQSPRKLESLIDRLAKSDEGKLMNPDGVRQALHKQLAETGKETDQALDDMEAAATTFENAVFQAALPAVPAANSDVSKAAAQDRIFRRFAKVDARDLDTAITATAQELASSQNLTDLGVLVEILPVLYAQAGGELGDIRIVQTLIISTVAEWMTGTEKAAGNALRNFRGKNGAQGLVLLARHELFDQITALETFVDNWRTPEESRRAALDERINKITATQQAERTPKTKARSRK